MLILYSLYLHCVASPFAFLSILLLDSPCFMAHMYPSIGYIICTSLGNN